MSETHLETARRLQMSAMSTSLTAEYQPRPAAMELAGAVGAILSHMEEQPSNVELAKLIQEQARHLAHLNGMLRDHLIYQEQAASAAPREEHWTCPHCDYMSNEMTREYCFKCARSRETRLDRVMNEADRVLDSWENAASSPHITGSPTTDSPWDAVEPDSTAAITRQYWPSPTAEEPSGRVEPNYSCARTGQHWASLLTVTSTRVDMHQEPPCPLLAVQVTCKSCGVSWWCEVTPAQAAATTTSTSAKPASSPSAVPPSRVDSKDSKLQGWTDEQLRAADWGARITLETVKGFIDGRLAIHREDFTSPEERGWPSVRDEG